MGVSNSPIAERPRTIFEAVEALSSGSTDIAQGDFDPWVHREMGVPFEPTSCAPGSEMKLAVLAERIERGVPLWHPHDRTDYNGLGRLAKAMSKEEAARFVRAPRRVAEYEKSDGTLPDSGDISTLSASAELDSLSLPEVCIDEGDSPEDAVVGAGALRMVHSNLAAAATQTDGHKESCEDVGDGGGLSQGSLTSLNEPRAEKEVAGAISQCGTGTDIGGILKMLRMLEQAVAAKAIYPSALESFKREHKAELDRVFAQKIGA